MPVAVDAPEVVVKMELCCNMMVLWQRVAPIYNPKIMYRRFLVDSGALRDDPQSQLIPGGDKGRLASLVGVGLDLLTVGLLI